MKKQYAILLWITTFLIFSVAITFAGEKIKVVVNNELVEAGEDLGASLVLNGTGTYDVYAAVTGGALGNDLYMFTSTGGLIPLGDTMPKLRENLNIGTLSTKDSIISLLPKMVLGGVSLNGIYTFYVALCTPGQLDFTDLDFISVTIQ